MSTVAGAACTGLRDLLGAPPAPARVVGVHPTCVYVATGLGVLAIESADGLGLPCALRLAADRTAEPFRHLHPDASAVVGAGQVVIGPLTVSVARWWAPRRVRPGRAYDRVDLLTDLLAAYPATVTVDAPVGDLLGLGDGLTPAGDDVIAGLLVAAHHCPTVRDPVVEQVRQVAAQRTTALSATLLRHAADGEAFPAVLDVADLLSGHGRTDDLPAAVDRLVAIGHSSGTALAHGLLRAARAVARQDGRAAA